MANGNANEERRLYLGLYLDESMHRALTHICNITGERPANQAEQFIRQSIKEMFHILKAQGTDVPPIVVLTAMQIEASERRNMRQIVRQLASVYLDEPTDDNAMRLEIACEVAGLVLEEIVEDSRKTPHLAQMIKDQGGKLTLAQEWLASNLMPGIEYLAEDVALHAKSAGISSTSLQRAKQSLKYIKSEKRGRRWVWVLDLQDGEGQTAPF